MLDGYGFHTITWNWVDQRFSQVMVASPADAEGRGILLKVKRDGSSPNLTGVVAYLLWKHRVTGKRGTVVFDDASASTGVFAVYYPAAMCGGRGLPDHALTG